MISKKIRLYPTEEQLKFFWQSVGVSRFCYNYFLRRNKEEYDNGNKNYTNYDCNKELVLMKKTPGFEWLKDVDSRTIKYATEQAYKALKNFFNGRAKFPKFKSRNKSKKFFYSNYATIKHVKSKTVKLAKVGEIKTAEDFPICEKYSNPIVSFDGVHWWLSFGYEKEIEKPELTNEVIGIDLGIKEFAVCSNGKVYKNINKTKRVKQLKKRYKRQQRKVSRQIHKARQAKTKLGKNFEKRKRDLQRTQIKLNNIRQNHLHQVTTEIVKQLPRAIVMEDLNVRGMMKNKHLSKAIAEQSFFTFMVMIEYKAKMRSIEVVFADKLYASSKICSKCGHKKSKLSLSERTYVCEECGSVIDRDLNAAINLRNLAI